MLCFGEECEVERIYTKERELEDNDDGGER